VTPLITIFLVALLTMEPALSVLALRTYQLTEEVTAMRLVGGCELWYFALPAQEVATFALARPRVDLIRLWPLPMQQPWCEYS